MSVAIDLADVKAALRVTHAADDDLLIRLIGSATRECLAFLDDASMEDVVTEISSNDDEATIPEDVFNGVVLLVQCDYEGDAAKRGDIRRAAEGLWMPYRKGLGV